MKTIDSFSKILCEKAGFSLIAEAVVTRSTWEFRQSDNAIILCVDNDTADLLAIDNVIQSIASAAMDYTNMTFLVRFSSQFRKREGI